jgi:hypothetical protein
MCRIDFTAVKSLLVQYLNNQARENIMWYFTRLLFVGLLVIPVSMVPVSAADKQAPSDSARVNDIGHSFARIMEITTLSAVLDSDELLKGGPSPEQLKEHLLEIERITEECIGLYNNALSNMETVTLPRLQGSWNQGLKVPLRIRTKILGLSQKTKSNLSAVKNIQESARSINPTAGDAAPRIMKLDSAMRELAIQADEALQEVRECPLYNQ